MAKKRRGRKKKGQGDGGWRRSPITALISLVVIALCLGNLFFGDQGSGNQYKSDYICTECRQQVRIPALRGASPFLCDECDKKALYPASKCGECSKVSANLPPLQDFSCRSCDYNGEHRFDGQQANHLCPECSKRTLSLTYHCRPCDHYFPYDPNLKKRHNEMEGFMVVKCPSCNKIKGQPLELEAMITCEFCDSENLRAVTPLAVIKWELGRDLKKSEQKTLDKWKAEQGL